MILLHFDEIAERSDPAVMALPPFTINNKDIQGQGGVLSTFVRCTKWIRCLRCTKYIRCFMCIKCMGLVGCSYIFGPFWAPGTSSWIAHKVWLASKTLQQSLCGWAACFGPLRDLYSTPRAPKTARFGPKQPPCPPWKVLGQPQGTGFGWSNCHWSVHFGWRHSCHALWRSQTTQMGCP